MKIYNLVLSLLILTSCNQSEIKEGEVSSDTVAISIDTLSIQKVKPEVKLAEEVKPSIGQKYLSGTVHQLLFTDDKNISITFERYYDGNWNKHSINGVYTIVNNSTIKVDWLDNNTISWLNTWGECGLQTVNQSHSFSEILSYNNSSNCILVKTLFKQSFYAGTRCGGEDKTENGNFEFCLN